MRAPSRVPRGGGEAARARRSIALAVVVAAWASACAAPPSADPAPDRVGAAAAYARAKVAWTEGARELAVGWYVRAVGLDPDSAELRAELGHALMITGDFARARDELAHARRLDVAGCAGAVDLAQLDLREQRAQSAAETLLEVVREEPGEARADFLAEVGRNEEAIAGYRRALALDPRRYAAERKAVRLLEQESERLLRKLAIPADPRVGLPAAKGAAVGSG